MKKIRVVYTDNSRGEFWCEEADYDGRTVSFVTTMGEPGEYIVIPYNNVFIIREREVKDDGSV